MKHIRIELLARLGACAALSLIACDGGDDPMDAGADAGSTVEDAAVADAAVADAGRADAGTDAGATDAGAPDGGGDCTSTGCPAGEACVRGVCVATCGADASGWDAALGPGMTPVASFCRAADAFGVRIDGAATEVFDVTSSPVSGGTAITLSRWRADPAVEPSPAVVGMATATHGASALFFGGGYVAASPTGASVAYGYTLDDFSGEVFEIATADGAVVALDAPGNFDAAWLDADTVLVNGLGLEGAAESGQALYAAELSGGAAVVRQIVRGLGSASGAVEVTGDYVLAGGFDDAFQSHVYFLERSAVEAAAAGGPAITVDETDEVLWEGAPVDSAFSIVHGFFVTRTYMSTEPYGVDEIVGRAIAYSAEAGFRLGTRYVLATGAVFTDLYPAVEGRFLFRFAEGLLLVQP